MEVGGAGGLTIVEMVDGLTSEILRLAQDDNASFCCAISHGAQRPFGYRLRTAPPTQTWQSVALLGGEVDGGFGGFPGDAQGAAGGGVVECDGEVFHRG